MDHQISVEDSASWKSIGATLEALARKLIPGNPTPWLLGIVLLHLVLAAGFARVIHPIDDEAYYASPAANLILKGHFGTTTYENPKLPNLEKRSYWVVPLYPLLLSVWFRVLGVGLWEQRLLSVLAGGLVVWAWYQIVLALSRNWHRALAAAALIAIDHTVLSAANGRPDLMGHTWGALGMAAYLLCREGKMPHACFLGYSGAALAGMTHPLPGVLAFANVTLLVFLLDRKRFTFKALAAACAPFIICAVALAIYVHPHWLDAYTQFHWNASYVPDGGRGRLSEWRDLVVAWWRVTGFILQEFQPAAGGSSAGWIKLVVPMTYSVAVAIALASPRNARGLRTLLVVALANWLLLPMIAGYQKWQYYLHVLVLLPPVTVLVLGALWRDRSRVMLVGLAVLISGTVLVQAARIVHSLKADNLGTRYQPSATRLREPPFDQGTFWGKAYWGYAVGLDRLTEDNDFGQFSHKRKDFLILTLDQPGARGDMPRNESGDRLVRMLSQEYRLVHEDQAIRVYARRPPTSP